MSKKIGIIYFCLIVLAGCHMEPDPALKSLVESDPDKKQIKATELESELLISKIEKEELLKSPPAHRYAASHLRSPFEKGNLSLLDKPVAEQQSNKTDMAIRARELLELYPLDSLKMVGFIQRRPICNSGKDKAIIFGLLRDTGGNIHRVKEGDYIGQNEGKITRIDDKGIQVQEVLHNNLLPLETKEIILPLVFAAVD